MAVGHFRIVSSEVGWGKFASDGSLGYDGGCCPAPLCRANIEGFQLLSAHAPSKVVVQSDEPLEVFGFLNSSARFDPRNPVEFWADWNFVGDVAIPGAATEAKVLRPGKHVLVTACGHLHSRHTIWAVRRAARAAEPGLAVLTIAAYPEAQVPSSIGMLARTARKSGIDLRVCFVGERYDSHSKSKITKLREVIQSLRAPRVMYVDGRDCLFLADIGRIEEAFGRMATGLVVSTEAECWPVRELAPRFGSQLGGCNWPNAGQWMGDHEAVVNALDLLEGLRQRAERGLSLREAPELAHSRHLASDDQFLWQVAWLNNLVELQLDYHGQLFRNVNTLDTTLGENSDFDLSDGVRFKASGHRPCVLHFSGYAADQCMHQWGGFLGAY